MKQFVAIDRKVEALGAAILATIVGLGAEVRPILAQYGLADIKPDSWYPQQAWLDVLREVSEGEFNATYDLISIGAKIPETAVFPPELTTVVGALQALDFAYHANHRNGEIGHYQARIIDDLRIDMICDNPYPCDFDYGIIFGLARRFRTPDMTFTIRHDDHLPCRKKGGESCTYHVVLQKESAVRYPGAH